MKKPRGQKEIRASWSREGRRLSRLRRQRARRRKHLSQVKLDDVEARLTCPAQFALEDRFHDPLVVFLRQLRQAFLNSEKTVCLDFRQTKLMVAGGTLLFYSELCRLKSMFPLQPVRCIPSRDGVVNQVLQHLGIFEKLGYQSTVTPNRPDVTSWRVVSSEDIDGDKVGGLLEQYKSISGPVAGQLFRGAGEAMFNVRHAYLEDRNDGLPAPKEKRWWMFCREADTHLFVAVCDLGIGIPRSLPIKYPSELISSIVANIPGMHANSDAKMIHAAMQLHRTSTQLKGRGKGLTDFVKVIDSVPGARLFIFSNRGLVRYQNGTSTRVSFQRSVKGTIVLWTIPIKGNQS